MKHAVSHDLGQERARQVADAALNAYKQKFAKYNPQSNWVTPTKADISFHVKGMTLKGALEVLPTSIEMDLDVPFLLKPFKGTAIDAIDREIREWIGKAKAGEL
jgi:hypothetical protein